MSKDSSWRKNYVNGVLGSGQFPPRYEPQREMCDGFLGHSSDSVLSRRGTTLEKTEAAPLAVSLPNHPPTTPPTQLLMPVKASLQTHRLYRATPPEDNEASLYSPSGQSVFGMSPDTGAKYSWTKVIMKEDEKAESVSEKTEEHSAEESDVGIGFVQKEEERNKKRYSGEIAFFDMD